VVSHRAQHLYDSLSGDAPAAPDADQNAVQLEADRRARDRLQLDRLRRSRAYADETAEALRRTQVRLDRETESLKLLERQSRLTEERLNQSIREANARLDRETESLKLLERQLRLTEERLNQTVREANQVGVAYQELRARVDRLKAHPVLALALKGRREMRNLVSRFKARRQAG
jgi:hypothetical protein